MKTTTSLLARQKVRDTWFEHFHIIIPFYHIQWCCARKSFWSFTPSDIGAEGEERQTAVAGLISWCESSQGESTTKWCLGCDVYWCGSVQCLFCFSPSCLFVCLFVLEGAECLKRLPTKLLMSVYLHSLGPFQLYRFLQADLRSLGWDWPSTEMHQKYHRQSTLPRPTMTSPYQEKVW